MVESPLKEKKNGVWKGKAMVWWWLSEVSAHHWAGQSDLLLLALSRRKLSEAKQVTVVLHFFLGVLMWKLYQLGSCCSSMQFQNDHGPASISVMEADWLSDATELLRPVAENRFLLAPARWMSRMSEPKPDRCYWRISFTFFTLNWNSLSHGNEKSLHGSSWKALKTSWIKNKKQQKPMNHLEKVFLSWRCLSSTHHNYSFIYLHSTQTKYIKLQVDQAEWGDVGTSVSDFSPHFAQFPVSWNLKLIWFHVQSSLPLLKFHNWG